VSHDGEIGGYINEAWLDQVRETVLEPECAIVDPHHHLWTWPFRYEMPETLADFSSSHTVRATVHVEAHGHYYPDGPEHLRPVGETAYIAAVAEEADRLAGPKLCAGIVGHVDVMRGAAVEEVLDAHIQEGRGRFRGIRVNLYWIMSIADPWVPSDTSSLLDRKPIAEALGRLARRRLSCDLVAFHSNLPDVARTAAAYEDTIFIVNHLGAPMTPEAAGGQEDLTQSWRKNIDELARRPNVRIKLGGWTNPMLSRSIPAAAALKNVDEAPSSQRIAAAYRPYVEHCIDRFGPARCMFESNFPVDKSFARYATLWNAFKRLAEPYSREERAALLAGTAAATYRV
jgi:L-fuconolactonase